MFRPASIKYASHDVKQTPLNAVLGTLALMFQHVLCPLISLVGFLKFACLRVRNHTHTHTHTHAHTHGYRQFIQYDTDHTKTAECFMGNIIKLASSLGMNKHRNEPLGAC